jgi:hypothetical protein
MKSLSTGSMAMVQICMSLKGPSTRVQLWPASWLRTRPTSAPAKTTSGRSGWITMQRTTPSNSSACPSGVLAQVAPLSLLRMTP